MFTSRLGGLVLSLAATICGALLVILALTCYEAGAAEESARGLLGCLSSRDVLLIEGLDGRIVLSHNEDKSCVPASTLKILMALVALDRLGPAYTFNTAFYIDSRENLKIKGFGDPLLISEAWRDIAATIADQITGFNDLILDDSYFTADSTIPGVGRSANPYDAPNTALSANFNTLYFSRDRKGNVVSAEPQTPIIPFARKRIEELGLQGGRYAFTHERGEATRYAGALFAHFLEECGVEFRGEIRLGAIEPDDRLLATFRSPFSLAKAIEKMLEFSNNFVANQILLALGAQVEGAPGTLDKGLRVVSGYARETLGLRGITIVEGSGVSRSNRLSARDMLAVLRAFEPYRSLLTRKGNVSYKSGTLSGVQARAGYVSCEPGASYRFFIHLDHSAVDVETLMLRLAADLAKCP